MPINSLEDLVFALLTEIGLGINQNGLLVDLDTGIELMYNGRHIRASIDPNNPAIPSDLYAIFDPIWDNKFMSVMLGYYLSKEESYGNIQSPVVSEDIESAQYYNKEDNIKTRRSRVYLSTGNKTISSNFYFQRGLKFSDLILRIGNHPFADLSRFDSIPEESISLAPMVTNVYPKDDFNY